MTDIRPTPIILIIEDEELLSQMYQFKFEHDGYVCHIANDGNEGIKKAQQLLPDIILCDIMMPNQDGLSFLEQLNANPQLKDIPVVMLTNLSETQYVDRATELGAISYIVKSKTTPAEVVVKVKAILDGMGKSVLV